MKSFIKEKGPYILAFSILLVYLSPNIFFSDQAQFLIHDNLDSNVVWYKNIAESPDLFEDNSKKLDFTMNGLERGVFVSEYSFLVWLYYFFSPLMAYQLNIILQCLVAFFGMYLFSKNYILTKDRGEFSYGQVLIALSFALLPFWPSGGIGVAGIPLLMYVLLNVYHSKSNAYHWLWIVFYPFYSSLFFSGLFVVTLLFLFFVVKMIRDRKINFKIIFAFFLVTVLYVFVEYRMFMIILGEGYDTAKVSPKVYNFNGLIGNGLRTLVKGQYHFHTVAFPFVIMVVAMAAFVANKAMKRKIIVLLLVNYGLAVMSTIMYWDKLAVPNSIKSFQFRWISFSPFLWYWLYSLGIREWLLKKNAWAKAGYAMLGLNVLLMLFVVGNPHFYGSLYAENAFYNTYFSKENKETATFKQYYKIDEFKKINKLIPTKTKVVCLGVAPEVAQYNGYYTLGGYYPLYLKEHNNLMLAMLGEENDELKIKNMGSRCYMTCVDLKKKNQEIIEPKFDFKKIKEEGYAYFFSDREIVSSNLEKLEEIEGEVLVYRLL
ncbi:MAG: DUF6044 family protein [Flavobacteriales bacterium]|jgi:hypothetical protein|nr:DUF6044 family protein [Flavobacteriales bacterium]